MSQIDYEKYLVREPLWEAGPGVKKRQSPTMTYMSGKQVPEANYYIELGWIYDIPEPNPHIHEHVHDFDEIVLHWGGNPETPRTSAERSSSTSAANRLLSTRPRASSSPRARPTVP